MFVIYLWYNGILQLKVRCRSFWSLKTPKIDEIWGNFQGLWGKIRKLYTYYEWVSAF